MQVYPSTLVHLATPAPLFPNPVSKPCGPGNYFQPHSRRFGTLFPSFPTVTLSLFRHDHTFESGFILLADQDHKLSKTKRKPVSILHPHDQESAP
jgi:hypothetical protein